MTWFIYVSETRLNWRRGNYHTTILNKINSQDSSKYARGKQKQLRSSILPSKKEKIFLNGCV